VPSVRVVIAPDAFDGTLDATAAARAIGAGWRRGAPDDELVLLPVDGGTHEPAGLDRALDDASLAVSGEGSFDWQSLRGTPVVAVARAAAARGVPCVVLAGQVSVGRREAAAAGVDAAYAVADVAGGVDASLADPAGTLATLAERVARRWSR
jgi:glycerate 2-kinase